MKNHYFFMLLLFFCIDGFSQAPKWQWVINTANIQLRDVATDTSGNVLVVGTSRGSYIPTAPYFSTPGAVVAKYTPDGINIWAKVVPGRLTLSTLTADVQGNVYAGGNFTGDSASGNILIGSDTLSNALSAQHVSKFLLVKYDRSGNIRWAKTTPVSGESTIMSLHTDVFGNCIVSGIYRMDSLTLGSQTIGRYGGIETFVAKFDSSGNVSWLKNVGGNSDDYSASCRCDASGNVYVSGYFHDTLHIDSIALAGSVQFDGYVIKLDSSGNALWAKQISGSDDEFAYAVTLDGMSNVYVGGTFHSTTGYCGSMTFPSYPGFHCNDIFLIKLDANGNDIWARSAGAEGCDEVWAQSTDETGHTFITGFFSSQQIYFNSDTLVSNGIEDAFVARYDANGQEEWSKSIGGSNLDLAYSIDADKFGNLFTVGYFQSRTADFDTIACQNTGPNGNNDLFFGRLSSRTSGFYDFKKTVNLSVYPNPFSDHTTISFDNLQNQCDLIVTDITGKEVMYKQCNGQQIVLYKEHLPAGIYFLKVADKNDEVQMIKLIVQ